MLAAAAGLFVAGALLLLFLGRYPELRAAEAESGAAAAAVA
jgi:hypothetical protein